MIGQRIAELRKEKKLSQYELAEKLSMSRGQLANYEQGQREPDFTTTQKIADFFEVSVDYLLGRSDHPKMTQEEEDKVSTENLKKIRDLISNGLVAMNESGEPMTKDQIDHIVKTLDLHLQAKAQK